MPLTSRQRSPGIDKHHLELGKTSLAKGADGGKFLDLLDDARLRFGLKLRVHRKRENLRSNFFGDREVAVLEAECFVGFLQMEGNRIVDASVDLGVCEVFLKSLAVSHSHHI